MAHAFTTGSPGQGAVKRPGMGRAAALRRLKIALAQGQVQVVKTLIDATPDLAKGLFGLEVALLDIDAVRATLDRDPTAAVMMRGPRSPFQHLAFSRCHQIWPDRSPAVLQIADMLLAHGADVNAPLEAPGGPLSPLYGALCHGDNPALGAWLLDHGADPNDGESLYHATELGHHTALRLLLDHGARPAGTNALLRAMDFDDLAAVQMLLDAGADPNGDQPALHHAARRMVSDQICQTLLDAGADPQGSYRGASAYAFARVFGHAGLARMIAARGPEPDLDPVTTILANAADGMAQGGVFIDPNTMPVAFGDIIREVLHLPGKLDHIRALVALGLPYDAPDAQGVTPVQAAGWVGLPDVMGFFIGLKPDLGHVNTHGGTLLDTIIHGSEHGPMGDHVGCARMAMAHGCALPRGTIAQAGAPDMVAFLTGWAAQHPGQVVD